MDALFSESSAAVKAFSDQHADTRLSAPSTLAAPTGSDTVDNG